MPPKKSRGGSDLSGLMSMPVGFVSGVYEQMLLD